MIKQLTQTPITITAFILSVASCIYIMLTYGSQIAIAYTIILYFTMIGIQTTLYDTGLTNRKD